MTNKGSIFFYIVWGLSLIASLGSLFYSEVVGFVPCSLCWYQRIFMYPACVILTLGIFKNDPKSMVYSVPLIFIGWIFSVYHNLLMWGIIPETASPCRSGIPCSTRYVEYLGFITIPFMALTAFSLMLMFYFIFRKNYEK